MIRNEASQLYYADNAFRIERALQHYCGRNDGLIAWLSALEPRNQSALRKLYLEDGWYNFFNAGPHIREFHSTLAAERAMIKIETIFVELCRRDVDFGICGCGACKHYSDEEDGSDEDFAAGYKMEPRWVNLPWLVANGKEAG